MASNQNTQTHGNQGKRTSFGGYPGGNASIFLDKAKAGIRGSTPDSEALASSDDEQEQQHRLQSIGNVQGSRPTRRPSWLTEVQSTPQRKGSLSGVSNLSPGSSHLSMPSNDQAAWPTSTVSSGAGTIGRGHSSSSSIPWGSAIWSNDPQKGPPSRLTEVLPSPTTVVPPSSAGFPADEALLSPTVSRDNTSESAIPFAIPLHPTLKTYRSQSYSVGQLDPDVTNNLPNHGGQVFSSRSRTGVPHLGLHHRPSRPSMLSDIAHDTSLLGQLREVDDDDGSSTGSEAGVQLSNTHTRTIEQLARENAMLRQAAAEQMESAKGRSRARTTTSRNSRHLIKGHHHRIHESVEEDSNYGYLESEPPRIYDSFSNEGLRARRSSEYTINPNSQSNMTGIGGNRGLESKKGHWQSSLDFGGIAEPPQSRRHSFADIPTRQTSVSSSGDLQEKLVGDRGLQPGAGLSSPAGYREGCLAQGDNSEYIRFRLLQGSAEKELELEHLRNRKFAASYFSGIDPSLRSGDMHGASRSPAASHQSFPSQSPYNRSQHVGAPQPRPTQVLYVVTFKACRADVFYISDGTGLQVKPGDLVIVEADRGTDLGTVARDNCSWAEARDLREYHLEEHFRWLMMFSRHGQNGTAAGPNPNGQQPFPNGAQNNVAGSIGTPSGQPSGQELLNSELKPKMIKRLAQAHEIQTLRDKEGNEAKAKRVCQQKVVEHRLNMEILDAEFQMDWKKLTFYYFADTYINFNPLVTDLFKIYKTRIWMSAINPASFATPGVGLQLPSGLGPGAFFSDSDQYSDRRHYRTTSSIAPVGTPQAMTYRNPGRIWDQSRDTPNISTLPYVNAVGQPFQTGDFEPRHIEQYPLEYSRGGQQVIGLQPRFNPTGYTISEVQNPMFGTTPDPNDSTTRKSDPISNEWTYAFQGLSLSS